MSDRSAFARLPKVDAVLDAAPLATFAWRREIKRRLVQDSLAALRDAIRLEASTDVPDAVTLATTVRARLEVWSAPRPARVLNGTGVILHTNLGRTPLSEQAIHAMADAARYCDLEVGMDDGTRGSRFVWLRPFISAVLDAEDAHVVNNNAGALLLACTVLGLPGGVVLSRGQMVEIGDSFRVATMAAAGGCPVIGVGSTNRTHAKDYELALMGHSPDAPGQRACAILWCHQSNFAQSGYVKEVSLTELAGLAKTHEVPLIVDLGSGSLGGGLPDTEPTIQQYLAQGADVVLASGDKLLGGPQCGIVAGKRVFVERCRRHPMARALRPDKTTIAALHATFCAHAHEGVPELPLHRMVGLDCEALRERGKRLCVQLGWPPSAVVDSVAAIGGGSLPTDSMASVALHVQTTSPSRTARQLRLGTPPVVGHIQNDRLVVDLRTIDPMDDALLVSALAAASAQG